MTLPDTFDYPSNPNLAIDLKALRLLLFKLRIAIKSDVKLYAIFKSSFVERALAAISVKTSMYQLTDSETKELLEAVQQVSKLYLLIEDEVLREKLFNNYINGMDRIVEYVDLLFKDNKDREALNYLSNLVFNGTYHIDFLLAKYDTIKTTAFRHFRECEYNQSMAEVFYVDLYWKGV